MDRLLPALEGLPPAYLVGGAVRDLLRGSDGVDLDLMVEADARSVARALASQLNGRVREHDRFGTATVKTEDLSFDLATSRRESYARPGALPDVAPAPLIEDLARRDFTINAMAAGLTGEDLGHLYDPHGGFDDLRAGLVRVLHDGSFVDDPTRLLRALRYEARLGFALESDTDALARKAAAGEALRTVSGARVRDELLDLLSEVNAPAAVERMSELGVDRAMHPALMSDPELVASAALGAATIGADRALSGLAALVSVAPAELDLWLADLHLRAEERDAVARAARAAPRLAAELRRELRPSELHELLVAEPPEALALALAMRAPAEPILRFMTDLRPVSLEISGDDLVAAGVPESPAVGEALRAVLRRKLDGELSGRDQELSAALEVARA
jgi:tRNA nucleotidyltransferase (CCA-adding enzyme)